MRMEIVRIVLCGAGKRPDERRGKKSKKAYT